VSDARLHPIVSLDFRKFQTRPVGIVGSADRVLSGSIRNSLSSCGSKRNLSDLFGASSGRQLLWLSAYDKDFSRGMLLCFEPHRTSSSSERTDFALSHMLDVS